MSDRPLAAVRAEIESLATTDGRFALVCARTRTRPTPFESLRFETRAEAERAARLVERYRGQLREYDPAVAFRDVVACERPILRTRPAPIDGLGPAPSRRVRFCHRLATALFEALRNTEHDDVERAVMNSYRTAADRIAEPDALCLRLLDEIAIELHERLQPTEQVAICREAASRLPAPAAQDRYVVVAAFERLATVDLLEQFTVSPWFHDDASGTESCAVEVREYALWPQDAAITTLPITVDVLRRQPAATVAIEPAVRLSDRSWEFRLETRLDAAPNGVARVPLDARV